MAQFSYTAGGSSIETSSSLRDDHVTRHHNSFLLPDDVTGDDELKRAMMSPQRHGLLMINSDTMDVAWAKRLWAHCDFKICADGGANRLYDGLVASGDEHKYIPDMIKGDLDSLRGEVKAFYSAAGTRIAYDFDQVTTPALTCIHTYIHAYIHMHSHICTLTHLLDLLFSFLSIPPIQ